MNLIRTTCALLVIACALPSSGQGSYSTSFEATGSPSFAPGDLNGQHSWAHLDNSPAGARVVAAPAGTPAALGSQVVELYTRRDDAFFVANHVHSPLIDPPAGETGSYLSNSIAVGPVSTFTASLWYRTPDVAPVSFYGDGRFAELNPSSMLDAPGEAANRYAQVRMRILGGVPQAEFRWFLVSGIQTAVLSQLEWGTWYRIEYRIDLVDGLDGAEPNDTMKVTLYDASGSVLGTACGSTWEQRWRNAIYGYGGPAQPRAINGFDFWSLGATNGTVVGYIDEVTYATASNPPPAVAITGSANACAAGTTTLTAVPSNASGPFTYDWRDGSDVTVGADATLDAGAGSYTLTITDEHCRTASDSFVIAELPPVSVSISGTLDVCYGGTTTLTANSAGGSGSVASYTWRDASNAIVGTAATFVAGVGSYTVTVSDASCGPATSAPVTVVKTCNAIPVVTWSNPADILYGTLLSGTQLNATASVAGTFTYTPPSGTLLDAGAGQLLRVDFTPTDSDNYDPVNGTTVQINVLPATPMVVVTGGTFAYDGLPHAATAVAEDAALNPVAGSIVITYDGNATVPVDAGTYAIVATFTSSDPNFTDASGNGSLTITPAVPAITVTGGTFPYDGLPHAASAEARDANGDPVSGSFTFTYDGSATVPVDAGTYAVIASFTSADPNFGDASGNGGLTIEPVSPVVTVTGGTFTYDGASHAASAVARDANGNPVSGMFTFTYDGSATPPANAGEYAVVASFTSADANFTDAAGSGTLTILRAPTSIAIQSFAPSPSAPGESVSVTFNLTGLVVGAGGTVTITNGTSSCSAVATAASCNLTFGTTGSILVTASYSGDPNHLPSSSDAVHAVEASPATAQVSRDSTICRGQSATLRVALQGTAPWRIRWSDSIVENVVNPLHTRRVSPTTTTTYRVTSVSDANGPGSVTGSAVVTVTSVETPQITGPLGARIGEALILRATPGLGTYQWLRSGVPIAGATGDTLSIAALTGADFASYTVVATANGCLSAASVPYALVLLGLPTDDDAVIPVVGNARGVGGSFFRTTLHLVNATQDPMEGTISFIDPALPSYPYALEPGETRFIDDLLPSTFEGLTSANIRRLRGPLPIAVAHVFNDGGEHGTSGLIERAVPLEQALIAGDRAVLVAPIDPVTTRFNVGVRTLDDGLVLRITHRDRAGAEVRTFERTFSQSTLVHQDAAGFAGGPIGSSDSLGFEVLSGSGVIYGAATDNGTNDPNMQIAARLEPAESGRYVLPVGGSVDGMFGSRFATGLQIHNPSDAPISVTVRFHPAGSSGTDSDPHQTFSIPARGTLGMDDVVSAIGATGFGSLDATVAEAVRPLLLARIYSIADIGQTSLMTELVPLEDVLVAGETGAFVAPAIPGALRFNIGVRTLSEGARVTATVRNPEGDVVRIVPLVFPPTWFAHTDAMSLLGIPSFEGNESVAFTIDEGSAVLYGVWTDNVTQDPAMQYAVRP